MALAANEDSFTPLYIRTGEQFCEAPASTVLCSARHLARAHFRPGAVVLDNLESLHDFLTLKLGPHPREIFSIILLDCRYRLIDYVELFEGSLDGATIYPRTVVECVLAKNASAVILVHNHPSGGGEPSLKDRTVTAHLKDALRLFDVSVVDHLIVGESITSMAARGMV